MNKENAMTPQVKEAMRATVHEHSKAQGEKERFGLFS